MSREPEIIDGELVLGVDIDLAGAWPGDLIQFREDGELKTYRLIRKEDKQ